MTFYIHPFVENTDDKNIPLGEWSIKNEMVPALNPYRFSAMSQYDFARRKVLETIFLQEDTSIL